jgi:UDP-glucose 4-epimerase
MTVSWVIGSGGLLGSALLRRLQARTDELHQPTPGLNWADTFRLHAGLDVALASFAHGAAKADAWEIYWAAGVGAMGSAAFELERETAAWKHLLQQIAANAVLADRPGRIVLASSAGAIYAGLRLDVISEDSPEAPTTPYAFAKLEQEHALRQFAAGGHRAVTIAARISTLYGPGQAYGKRQGLIAHIARSIVRNRPVQIFVPFDTVRDYITADDAASLMIGTTRVSTEAGMVMRIVASERPTTIAEIVSTFRRVARRPPLIATSASGLSALYPRCVQFRSTHSQADAALLTGLHIGIAQVLAAERLAYAAS